MSPELACLDKAATLDSTGGSLTVSLTGTYRLVRCEIHWADGRVELPYGSDPEGLLVYTPGGYVTGHLMRRDVTKFRTSARKISAEQAKEAFLGYLGYYGTYVLDEENSTVTHHVLGSWHPNWVGTNQVRYFHFEEESLVIETPAIASGSGSYRTRLVWRNAEAAQQADPGRTPILV